jgi:hypothetical protein
MFGLKRKREWCCAGFHAAFERAGKRGIGVVIAQTDPTKPSFRFQFRSVDKGLESFVTAMRPDVAVSIVEQMGAQYCPWCGQNLVKWYGKRFDSLYRPDLAIDGFL